MLTSLPIWQSKLLYKFWKYSNNFMSKLVLEMTYINQNVDTGIVDSQLFYVSFISKISSGNILIVLYKFWK